ncbi:MAG: hypothetical protein ACLQPV_03175 [Vulcanimicrobiaceae bacterium]
MNALRVPLAIASARLRADRKAFFYACAAAGIAGFVQRGARLEGPLFFCSLLGIIVALIQGPGRHRYLDLCEQSAPLFGRQLARGKALAPCVAVALACLAYGAGIWIGDASLPFAPFAIALAGSLATTLVALSATIREGSARALYVAFAAATSGLAFASATRLPHWATAISLVFCVAAGFVALRQYGEALARWDPAGEA